MIELLFKIFITFMLIANIVEIRALEKSYG